MNDARMRVLAVLLSMSVASAQVGLFPPTVIGDEVVARWSFAGGTAGWTPTHDATLSVADAALEVRSTGEDPYLHGPALAADGELVVRLRARFDIAGDGQVFFATREQPWDAEERSAHFAFPRGVMAECECPLGSVHGLTRLRLDPGSGVGVVRIEWIELRARRLHPLRVESLVHDGDHLMLTVDNATASPLDGLAPGTNTRSFPLRRDEVFQEIEARVVCGALPPLEQVVQVLHLDAHEELHAMGRGDLKLLLAADGRGALVEWKGRRVAALHPLAMRAGHALRFAAPAIDGDRVTLVADDVRIELEVDGDSLAYRASAADAIEGPVVRTLAAQDRALFPGLEFLVAGEESSSTADIETDAHWRQSPDPRTVTLPCMAAQCGVQTLSLSWDPRDTRPCFLTPDRLDGEPGVRMALRSRSIAARLRIVDGTLEDALDQVTRDLPAPPTVDLDDDAWRALCLRALQGPLHGEGGFGHCAEANWPRCPYADHASAWFRLTGEIPAEALPGHALDSGGAHQRDDSIFLLTGRARDWLAMRAGEAAAIRAQQQSDGSFRYAGKYRRGHFEDTASGWCAAKAVVLLEHARIAGDRSSLEAGLRALEYLQRFRTPRGAQTWELSLHTPDILAAAAAVTANLRAFQCTGDRRWLSAAHTWAQRGLPFVYLGDDADSFGSTIAVFGATNWRAPLWIGLPVQWCGLVYAQALAELAAHDDDPRWRRIAEAVLARGKRMQAKDGPLVGCLPDSFHLDGGGGAGPWINPCAMLYLDATLHGSAHGLDVQRTADGAPVVSPFPLRIEGDVAVVQARKGLRYQVVIGGERVIDVDSDGEDRIDLPRR